MQVVDDYGNGNESESEASKDMLGAGLPVFTRAAGAAALSFRLFHLILISLCTSLNVLYVYEQSCA